MRSLNLNLDWFEEVEDEEGRKRSLEALGSSDEEINRFVDSFLHEFDSDISQSNRRVIDRSEGMGQESLQLGLGLGLDLNDGLISDEAMVEPFSEDVRVVENGSNTNNEEAMMVVEPRIDFFRNDFFGFNGESNEEFDCDAALGMMIDADDERLYSFLGNSNEDGSSISDELYQQWDNLTRDIFSSSKMTAATNGVETLPSLTLTEEDLENNDYLCAVCTEKFTTEEKVKKLPCFHYYHEDCILPWLRIQNTCPVCRCELPIR